MKKVIISLLCCVFIALLSACSQLPKNPASANSISFTCPEGWETSEIEGSGGSYTLSVEKSGDDESGIVVFVWVSEEIQNAENLLKSMKETLEANKNYSNLKYQKTEKTKYGKFDAIISAYTTEVLSLPHQGRVIAFSDNGITVCIVEQEAAEDAKKNIDGFKLIEESLEIVENEGE